MMLSTGEMGTPGSLACFLETFCQWKTLACVPYFFSFRDGNDLFYLVFSPKLQSLFSMCSPQSYKIRSKRSLHHTILLLSLGEDQIIPKCVCLVNIFGWDFPNIN